MLIQGSYDGPRGIADSEYSEIRRKWLVEDMGLKLKLEGQVGLTQTYD